MTQEIIKDDYFSSILEEYSQLSRYDLKRCINLSAAEYFNAKKAFIVKDKIYLILDKNIHVLNRNSIRVKDFKKFVKKNFELLVKINEIGIDKRSIKLNSDVVLYGKKDFENDDFILLSIYYKKQIVDGLKAIIYKDELNYAKNTPMIADKDIIAICLDFSMVKKHDEVFILKGNIYNRSIVNHELSLAFSKINQKLEKKIYYELTYINYKKAIITIKLNRAISRKILNLLKYRIKAKLFASVAIARS